MKMKKFLTAAQIAAGTGLYLLDRTQRITPRMRRKIGDQLTDFRDRAKDAYADAADRMSHASKALRKNNTHSNTATMLKFAVGLGVGAGVGLLMAPRKGEDTRHKVAEKARNFRSNVRQHWSSLDIAGTRDSAISHDISNVA
ncbi:MAG TPA: YtxH domain-containing protein [Candidatus Methylomirabilis sp.]|nr:YtxH domain-containing protein [Candidatus Methylomirabilis sp.]